MAWTYQGKTMKPGRSWKDTSGRMYPAQWYGRTTDAEKTAVGWVHVADPAPYDSRFYFSAGNAKDLDDLKDTAIKVVKKQAGSLLAPTDWYVIRNTESSVAIPTDVATYRSDVRTASQTIETAITACTTLDQFIALYDVPVDADGVATGNAPINNWPDAI